MGYGRKPKSAFRQTKIPIGRPRNKNKLKEQVIQQIQANRDSVHVDELLPGISREEKARIINEMTRDGTVVIDHDDYGNEWVGI
jgi:peptidyl-tRNA hydrolase